MLEELCLFYLLIVEICVELNLGWKFELVIVLSKHIIDEFPTFADSKSFNFSRTKIIVLLNLPFQIELLPEISDFDDFSDFAPIIVRLE